MKNQFYNIDNITMDLTKYKDVLGVPGEGKHKDRINLGFIDVAAFDTIGTFIIALIIAIYLGKSVMGFVAIAAILLILGELLHWVFGVRTAVMKSLT